MSQQNMTYIELVKIELQRNAPRLGKTLLDYYALLVLVKGDKCTAEDVHDAWALNEFRKFPEHWSIVPFRKLKPEVQAMDDEYAKAIRLTAKALGIWK